MYERRAKLAVVGLAALATVLAGCNEAPGASAPPPPRGASEPPLPTGAPAPPPLPSARVEAKSYTSVAEIVEELKYTALSCTDVRSLPPAEGAKETALCASGESELKIFIYTPATIGSAEVRLFHELLFQKRSGSFVVGPTWMVESKSSATAERVASVLGGRLHS